jgi:RND family efflux transporter MFP subunit
MNGSRTSVACLLVGALAFSGCGPGDVTGNTAAGSGSRQQSSNAGDAALVKVTPIKPVRKTLVRWTVQPGQIEAFEETPLFAKLASYVEKMHVDIGDRVTGPQFDSDGHVVREGQLLVELSVPELDEELAQKEAAVGQAKAEVQQALAAIKVAKASESAARSKVEESEAVVDQSQADYEFAASEFARLKKLADKGAVTREVADEKEKLLKTADSVRKQTQARIASAKALVVEKRALVDKSEADLEAAKQHVLAAEADVAKVKALIGYTRIRAPYDGVITTRSVHTGHLVLPGTEANAKPLLVIVQTRKMRIFVDVPESDAARITPGANASITIPSSASESRTGTITRISWTLSAGSRTLRAEIDVDNADGSLRPGMYAKARLIVAEREGVLSLPKGAVLPGEEKWYCCTVDADGVVSRTPIETGIRTDDDVEIVSGVSEEDQIIGTNAAAFREGQRVEVVDKSNAGK